MSQYATTANLASLALPAGALAGISTDDQNAHLSAASELADSYLVARGYAVPLVTWGNDVRMAVAAIAAWTLLRRRGVNPEDPSTAAIAKAHDDAIAWFRDIAKGVATPNIAVTAPAAAVAALVKTSTKRGW